MVTLNVKYFALLSHNAAPHLNIIICYMTEHDQVCFYFTGICILLYLMEFIHLGMLYHKEIVYS